MFTPAADTAAPTTLADFLAQAEDAHASSPAATLAALLARAPTLVPDADTADALRLAEHVALAHLGDAAPLVALRAALPPALAAHGATAPAVQRLAWVLAMAGAAALVDSPPDPPAGPPADPPPDATRWRALQNLVLALAVQGRWAAAAALLAADEAVASAHGKADAGMAYAASANNVAAELLASGPPAGAPRDPGRDGLMLQAAAIARRAWGRAGTWRHVERAEYRLAMCHAAAGLGADAVQHARLCLAGCDAAGDAADAVEHFFAHEAMAQAQLAAGDALAAQAARARMAALLPQIDEADGLRAWCAEVLHTLHAPQG